jgi:GH25 family lysozyme M1 (1,4-beta-N-acetylmuramidase)
MSNPFVIDLYQGDNVEDTPGPLGGFARVKASGIAFLIHKATEGTTLVDRRYQPRRLAWMDGIAISVTDVDGGILQLMPRFAAYHFFHGQDPEAEAQHFLATAQLKPGDDAVVDWEQVGASGYEPSADAVDAFCNVVERELGFPIIVYSGNVAKDKLSGKDPRFANRRLWLASYGPRFSVQESWDYPWLWQDDGDKDGPGPHTIPGIDGYCDNSTVVGPVTVKRLYAEWGGGVPQA